MVILSAVGASVVYSSEPVAYAEWSTAVALKGNVAIVGSGSRSKKVSVFAKKGENWSLTTDLLGGDAWEKFGMCLSLNQETIAVGAIDRVYLYSSIPNHIELVKLEAKEKDKGYGTAVYLTEDARLLVGAPLSKNSRGAVFIYNTHDYVSHIELKAKDDSSYLFGQAIAGSTKYIAIGAPGGDRGSVHLFDAKSYSFKCKLMASKETVGHDAFGSALAVSDQGLVAIGAPLDDTLMYEDAGSVSLYDGCTLVRKVYGNQRGGFFGSSISLSSDHLLISRGDSSQQNADSVLITLLFVSASHADEEPITIQLNASGGGGGSRISFDQDWVLIGMPSAHYFSPQDTMELRAAGAATFFRLSATIPDITVGSYQYSDHQDGVRALVFHSQSNDVLHPLSHLTSAAVFIAFLFLSLGWLGRLRRRSIRRTIPAAWWSESNKLVSTPALVSYESSQAQQRAPGVFAAAVEEDNATLTTNLSPHLSSTIEMMPL